MGLSLAVHALDLGEAVQTVVTRTTTVLTIVFIAWSAANFVTSFRKYYIDPITERTETRLDDQIIPIIERALKIVIWSMAVLIAFANLGYDRGSLPVTEQAADEVLSLPNFPGLTADEQRTVVDCIARFFHAKQASAA